MIFRTVQKINPVQFRSGLITAACLFLAAGACAQLNKAGDYDGKISYTRYNFATGAKDKVRGNVVVHINSNDTGNGFIFGADQLFPVTVTDAETDKGRAILDTQDAFLRYQFNDIQLLVAIRYSKTFTKTGTAKGTFRRLNLANGPSLEEGSFTLKKDRN